LAREAEAARLEAERARALAEDAALARDHFLATVSHEIRSPLGVVLTWTRMLRRGLIADDEVPHVLSRIAGAAKQQSRLGDDLLHTSRIIARKFSRQPEPLPLAALLGERLEAMRETAAGKRLTVDTQMDHAVVVRGDPTRLRQVFENLLSNAIKF